jgi:hypothetical protein
MSARSFGEIVGGLEPAKQQRTFQPVRRNSYHVTDRRAAIWRPIAPTARDARRLISARLKAAEFYDRKHKPAGKKNGPLGHVGLEVLRELYRIVDFKTGRLEPAIATLCDLVKRSRAAVVDALARLKAHGFLTWVRRTEPVDNDGAGPQIRQITNAYAFSLPKYAAAWVRKICGNGPAPDSELARKAADAAEVETMLDQAGNYQAVDYLVGGDSSLNEILKRVGAALSKNSASSLTSQNPASDI